MSESVKIILRFPNGFRKSSAGLVQNGVLYRVVPIFRIKREAFELNYEDVDYQQTNIGKFLGLPLYQKVVDVDYNAHSSMGVVRTVYEVLLKNAKVKRHGKTIKTTCKEFVDNKKKDFYTGIAMGKWIEAEKKKFDLMAYVSGIGTGAIIFKIVQSLLATQNVVL